MSVNSRGDVQRMAGGGVVRGRVMKLVSSQWTRWTARGQTELLWCPTSFQHLEVELLVPVSAPSSDSFLPPEADGGWSQAQGARAPPLVREPPGWLSGTPRLSCELQEL